MKRSHARTLALPVMVWLAMPAAPAWAETRIGVASIIKPNTNGITAGTSQTLAAGSEVYANETIRTGNLGQADLVFLDQTNLTVGPTSEVLLDKFVYDPTGSKGKVVFKATRGAFRFVTGTQDHRAYSVNTPFGTLGVRGTKVEVVVTPPSKRNQEPGECATKVRLIEGQASFTTSSGKLARLTEPDQTVCISPTGAISYGSSSTSILGFQLASEQQSPPPSAPTPPPAGPGNPGGPPVTPPCTTHCVPP
jgi:FecR protein